MTKKKLVILSFTILLWAGFLLIGSLLLDGVEQQHVPGRPMTTVKVVFFLIPSGMLIANFAHVVFNKFVPTTALVLLFMPQLLFCFFSLFLAGGGM